MIRGKFSHCVRLAKVAPGIAQVVAQGVQSQPKRLKLLVDVQVLPSGEDEAAPPLNLGNAAAPAASVQQLSEEGAGTSEASRPTDASVFAL